MGDPLERLQSSVGAAYEIERELGRGGMATVYLARDLRHGRPVALKLLRPELAVALGAISALSGFAIYKPVQLAWLTSAFGGYELARYWHFVAVWLFIGFTLLHVSLVFLVDPASLRGMITGWYRGRFPSHD